MRKKTYKPKEHMRETRFTDLCRVSFKEIISENCRPGQHLSKWLIFIGPFVYSVTLNQLLMVLLNPGG
jgi:hypothetical protein